jgi:trehalose/maltose transport system permease protein
VLSGLFALLRTLHIYNSWTGLTLSYLIFTLPFTTWVLTAFMRQIPRSLEEAAVLDGASPLKVIFNIFLPIMAPSVVTTFLLSFIAAWNEFLFALTFTFSDRARTVPVAMSLMSGASSQELPWANLMAASVVVTFPLLFLVIVFQKRIIAGLTAGAVKG